MQERERERERERGGGDLLNVVSEEVSFFLSAFCETQEREKENRDRLRDKSLLQKIKPNHFFFMNTQKKRHLWNPFQGDLLPVQKKNRI